tara:strand:- start:212 stop:916 length:705 start_codon:yes stop_codon:yes gene_type:complete
MVKFFRNIFILLKINTPYHILFKFIKNFIPNYKTKKKSNSIEKIVYNNFITENEKNKWFCNNLYFLKNNLPKNFNPENILEIGSFEGRSAIFFTNFYPNSLISCVDTWEGSDEHKNFNFFKIENNFNNNTKYLVKSNRLKKYKKASDIFFSENNILFDLIYIDGDHSSEQLCKDIYNSWKFLKKNGILVVDDYVWWFYKDIFKNPAFTINKFITEKLNQIKDLIVWKQVIIFKK